jgi:hypothetical protein
MSAGPGTSDVNLFRYCQGVIYFDAQVSDRAFDLGMSKQKLNGPEISGPPVDQGSRLNIARSRVRPSIWSFVRIDQTCFGRSGGQRLLDQLAGLLLAHLLDEQEGRALDAAWCRHRSPGPPLGSAFLLGEPCADRNDRTPIMQLESRSVSAIAEHVQFQLMDR